MKPTHLIFGILALIFQFPGLSQAKSLTPAALLNKMSGSWTTADTFGHVELKFKEEPKSKAILIDNEKNPWIGTIFFYPDESFQNPSKGHFVLGSFGVSREAKVISWVHSNTGGNFETTGFLDLENDRVEYLLYAQVGNVGPDTPIAFIQIQYHDKLGQSGQPSLTVRYVLLPRHDSAQNMSYPSETSFFVFEK